MRKPRKVSVLITMDKPPNATLEDIAEYVCDAVTSWNGSFFPGDDETEPDPMYELDRNSVAVKVLKRARRIV